MIRPPSVRAVLAALIAAAATVTGCLVPAAHASRARRVDLPVIAVVGESGVNVLHHDFRTADGRTPRYPARLGHVDLVSLPAGGSFATRRAAVQRGVLGNLEPGVLYGIAGTRLLVVSAPGAQPLTDVEGGGTEDVTVGAPSDPTLHGTGVVDAAIGRRYGTAPEALGLIVLGNMADSWRWVAAHEGIDVATMSSYEVVTRSIDNNTVTCDAARDVRAFVGRGGLAFSSSGNTTDLPEQASSPNGLPEVYQVGGVRADGQPWGVPPHQDADPVYMTAQVTRPYETGDLYSFTTASYDGDTTTMRFGGTSGATPRTAGRAADLLYYARTLLHRGRPHRGPLSDGSLAGSELTTLLHHIARPYLPDHPQAFMVEGYGAIDPASMRLARRVLSGAAAEPGRAADDAMQADVDQMRTAASTGC